MLMFCQFGSAREPFTHGMCITALIHPSDLKTSIRFMYYRGMMPKFSGAVAVVVTSRSSSIELVPGDEERNVFLPPLPL